MKDHLTFKQARAVKEEIKITSHETKKTELETRFKKIHGLSMLLNLFNLVGGLILVGFSVHYLRIL